MSQRISSCLWLDDQAEETVAFYISVFSNSRVLRVVRYGDAGHDTQQRPPGPVMTIDFELDGQPFTALNGGPVYKFNEAISLQVACSTREEIDFYWDKLREEGDETGQQCGWLKDKYGVSGQVVPAGLAPMLADPVAERTRRVTEALLKMKKLESASSSGSTENEPSAYPCLL